MVSWSQRALGAAAGLVADSLFGEPPVPARLHPVALFGTAADRLEERIYDDRRANGALYASLGAAVAGAVGWSVGSPAAASYLSSAGKGLHSAALAVADALDQDDVELARSLLPNLVGRDPSQLDAAELARAAVESVAENTTDAVVAPALWVVVAGAPGAFVHRAADTLDSMVGYRNERYGSFGTAAARMDDVLAWVPARATAALVAAVRPRQGRSVWETVRRDSHHHPSPNAGVAEAAFAAALGVRLGGTNTYAGHSEARPFVGDGRPVAPTDIRPAVRLSRDVAWLLAATLGAAGLAGRMYRRRSAFLPPKPAAGHGFRGQERRGR